MRNKLENPDEFYEKYLSGNALYGDDFNEEQINQWYLNETEGFSDLYFLDSNDSIYDYFELDKIVFGNYFRPLESLGKVLGVGSAFGHEFKHLAGKVESLTILDPGVKFHRDEVYGIKAEYIKPSVTGKMDFPDNTFNLVSALSSLHHVANVTYVIKEIYRVLKPGGTVILRDPITSMGDWRNNRPGLTIQERGIPVQLFRKIIKSCGFKVEREVFHYALIPKLSKIFKVKLYNNKLLTPLDLLMAKILSFNLVYHRTLMRHRFAPGAVIYILKK